MASQPPLCPPFVQRGRSPVAISEAAAGFLSFTAGHAALEQYCQQRPQISLWRLDLGPGTPSHPAKARRGFPLGRSLHAIPMAIEAFAKRAGYALVDEFYDAAGLASEMVMQQNGC